MSLGLRGGLDPRTFLFLRFALAAPMMVMVAMALGKKVIPLLRSRAVWVVGFLNAVGFLCQFVGQQYTDPSVASLLVNLSVVLAAGGGALFLGEKFGALKMSGILLAVLGTVFVSTNGSFATIEKGELVGDGLYLVAAVAWAGYIVYAKKKTDELNWDPVSLATGIVIVTATFVLPVAATAGSVVVAPSSLLAIGYTAVFNTAIPFILYQQGLRYLTASSSALVLTLEIVVAVGISVAFFGDVLSALAWAGAAMILVSIILVSGIELRKTAS